ncbi:MAG TPA: hypothetical protein VMW55_03835 [Nitrosopumilaceae archaeon]|jgi:hypothetical protein|nr:hypothetical protein [Nitrosopumilaceae archaeon]
MTKTLYDDKFIRISEDKIQFKSWVLPWGKKDVMLSHIIKISERKIGIFSGKGRISGTGNFRDWFHFDLDRPKKDKAIVLETDFKIYKRLWITPERHGESLKILKKLLS